MPQFRRKVISGLHGPKYQFFKREMDKRFVATYGNKLKRHRLSLRQAALKARMLKSAAGEDPILNSYADMLQDGGTLQN